MLAVLYDSLNAAEARERRVASLLLQRVRRTPVVGSINSCHFRA